jgi:transposase
MATIIKKIKKGRAYYYAVKSKRVEGKPRIVWQKYLGTVEGVVRRADGARPSRPKEAVIFELGGLAALVGIAQRLGLVELINEEVGKRDQGPSVGDYILLAALNRALAPCSKQGIGDWYEQTVLSRLWGFRKSAFSSQRFWDHMGMVSEQAIERVEERLIGRIKSEFDLDPRLLLYDTTNFFTFLSTANGRAELPQRGHSKAKRHDLRQVGLALLASRQFQVPLLHRLYPGNIPDVSLFPKLFLELSARFLKLTGDGQEATLVFDRGNVCDEAMENLLMKGIHFVAALPANRLPQLLAVSPEKFENMEGMPGTRAFSATAEIWGKKCQAVVVYTESFFTQQLLGVTNNLVKCQKRFQALQRSLLKWSSRKGQGKRPTARSVGKRVREILAAQFMKELFKVEVSQQSGLPQIKYQLDHNALNHLCENRLGRTLLITDRLEWDPRQVVEVYRSLASVEETFKNMKNVHFLRFQPAYHWTDQKLKVHAFYCVLALMLASLARKVVVQAGIEISLPAMLKELCAIREVALIYPPGTLAHRKDHITLSRMSPRQRKLAEILNIAEITIRG